MSEWKKVKLGEITIIKTGKLDSNAAVPNGAYPFFTCDPTTLSIDKWAYDTEAILLAGNNASGNYTAKYYKGKFNAYQRTYIIETLNPQFASVRYMAYAMNQQLQLLKVMSSGSTTKFLTMKMLTQLSIDLPSIETQNRIATILSRYDSLIENYQKQIKLLEEAAQRLYKEWFVDLHFLGHENTKIVDGVPEGWEKKTLGELFSYIRGKSYSSNEISDEGCIMVNLKNIQAFGGYKRDAEKRFIGEYKPEQTLQKGDLVMGVTDMTQERRLVGHVALIPDFNEPAIFSMDLIKIIPYSVPIIYLYCAMRYGGISKRISPLANGVNVLHLKPDAMMGTMMVIPRKDLIERFCPFVEEMVNKILKNQSQIRLLTEARDRLLPKIMSGEIEFNFK